MEKLPDETCSFMHRELTARWADVIAARLTAAHFDQETATFTGAVYRPDGSIVLESLRPSAIGHWRPVDPVSIPWMHKTVEPTVMDTAIYGGHFFTMWGHFLYETLGTAALALDLPHVPVIFTSFGHDPSSIAVQRDWSARQALLSAAGWGDRPLMLQDGATRFSRLLVPERLSVYAAPYGSRGVSQEMATVYDRVRKAFATGVKSSRKLVARRPAGFHRAHPEEEVLYELLEREDFTIIDGANLPLAEQVEAFAGASLLVGFTGSNLHNSVFCHQGTRVLELGDIRSYESIHEKRNRNQIDICAVLNQEHLFIETFSNNSGQIKPLSTSAILADVLSWS